MIGIASSHWNRAVTVWLNEQAVRDNEEVSTGFLGAAIIDDFADALCAAEDDLPALILDAQRAAIEKAAKEEQRALKELSSELAAAARDVQLPAWDAKADDDADPWGDSIFAAPAEQTPQGWEQTPSWSNGGSPAASDAAASPDAGAKPAQKFCMACGTKLPFSAAFCSSCGAKQETV